MLAHFIFRHIITRRLDVLAERCDPIPEQWILNMNRSPLSCLQYLLVLVILVLASACGSPAATPVGRTPAATLPQPTAVSPVSTGTTATPQPTLVTKSTAVATVSAPTATPGVAAVALVNNQAVPLQDYENQVALAVAYLSEQENFDPTSTEGKAAVAQVRQQVLSWMVDQILIEQAATSKGISIPTDKIDSEIAELVGTDRAKFEQWLKDNQLTEESFRTQLGGELLGAALQEQLLGSKAPAVEQVHARHILVATEDEAMNVLIKLTSGETFASLAAAYSQDRSTSSSGGDLGYFPRGVMPREIEDVAFSLPAGRVSGIVKSEYGYHIIEVMERDSARTISDELLASWRQNAFVNWLGEQRTSAQIEYLSPVE
jgi:parvulin-like peptidyl-prolyl isomerase